MLKSSPSWGAVDEALQALGVCATEPFLSGHMGKHNAATSPIVTTVVHILQTDLWRSWGVTPSFALGHSIGELVAAYASGLLTLFEALKAARDLGEVALGMQVCPLFGHA